MSPLLIVAALAAQVGAPSADKSSAVKGESKISSGQTTYIDIEAGAGYSSNPNLTIINDQGAAFGRISIHGVHSRVSARSSTLISAFAENDSYTNGQSSQQSASLNVHHDAAVSEHVRLFADLSGSYQEGGLLDTRVLSVPLIPPFLPGGTVTPPILVPGTGDFLSVTGRTYTLSGHGGGTFALSQHDSVSVSSGVDHVVFRTGAVRTAYTSVPISLGYDRQLSERTTVGARIVAQSTDYDGPASTRVITPQLTGRVLLAPRISLDGAVGVSFARVDNGLVVHNSTGLSAQANLCGQGETTYFCGHFAVDEQTATTAGPTRSISGGLDFTKRLDANQSVSLSAGVTHYSTPMSIIGSQIFSASTYYHAAASYSRHLGSRLFGGVNLSARDVTQNGPDPKADLSASLFIRYHLGDIQ